MEDPMINDLLTEYKTLQKEFELYKEKTQKEMRNYEYKLLNAQKENTKLTNSLSEISTKLKSEVSQKSSLKSKLKRHESELIKEDNISKKKCVNSTCKTENNENINSNKRKNEKIQVELEYYKSEVKKRNSECDYYKDENDNLKEEKKVLFRKLEKLSLLYEKAKSKNLRENDGKLYDNKDSHSDETYYELKNIVKMSCDTIGISNYQKLPDTINNLILISEAASKFESILQEISSIVFVSKSKETQEFDPELILSLPCKILELKEFSKKETEFLKSQIKGITGTESNDLKVIAQSLNCFFEELQIQLKNLKKSKGYIDFNNFMRKLGVEDGETFKKSLETIKSHFDLFQKFTAQAKILFNLPSETDEIQTINLIWSKLEKTQFN